MEYIFLTIAIIGELIGTMFLKYSKGFTRLLPSIVCIVAYCICFFSFSKALNGINLSIAYATWCGVGIIISTLISVFIFKEQISFLGIIGIVLVVAGTILLNLFGSPTGK